MESSSSGRPGGLERTLRQRLHRLDDIERFALLLMALGAGLVAWGAWIEPPGSLNELISRNAHDWAPGLVIDGLLLWVVNGIFRRHERKRVLSQMGSLSREFALDAARRAREEGWLADGSLAGWDLSRAALQGAHVSNAVLHGADLSFADLEEATLAYSDLRGADLTGAHLAGADLRWADLTDAVVSWADLRGALLEGTTLDGIDARFASIDARQAGVPALAEAIVGGFLDAEQVQEVRRTFDLLAEHGTKPIERFYERLFEMAPEARGMFRSEPGHQATKFLHSLRVIVSALHSPRRHVAVLQSLGKRHDGYGVQPHHYALVADVFLAVFADTLGAGFTPSAREAWERAFELMATIMTGSRAARPAAKGEAPAPEPVPA